jgi:hypothetical protein
MLRHLDAATHMQARLILANIAVLVILALLAAFYRELGWQFALGGIFGAFLTHLTIRLHYGRWL